MSTCTLNDFNSCPALNEFSSKYQELFVMVAWSATNTFSTTWSGGQGIHRLYLARFQEFWIIRQKFGPKVPVPKHRLSVQKVVQQIFGNIFLDYTCKIFFTLDDAVLGTRWPEAKKSALTTPKDRTMKDELDNFLNRLYRC